MEIMGVSLRDLAPLLVIVAWVAVVRWVLPRFGVRT